MSKPFQIEFDYTIEGHPKTIHLIAVINIDPSGTIYEVTEIKTSSNKEVLSAQKIKKIGMTWIHTDSEKETSLSRVIGKAIELKSEIISGS